MSFTDGLNTIVDEVEKFGTGSQIPVGTRGADMAQVGRQSCDAGINIETMNTSEIRISVLCREDQLNDAVRALHEAFELGGEEEAVVHAGTGR